MLTDTAITLCAISSWHAVISLSALQRSITATSLTKALLLCSSAGATPAPSTIRYQAIPKFSSVEDYSDFIPRRLADYIKTDYVLIVQWDGYVLHPEAWDDAFYEYDYIGAVWPHFEAPLSVGNGGFSLRSRRLLKACQDQDFVYSHPEDKCICHQNRELLRKKYKIRFAPPEVAERFSYERQRPKGKTFGFHGFFNFPDFMPPDELNAFLDSVPDELLRGRDAHDLCRRLLAKGDRISLNSAARIYRQVSRSRPWGPWKNLKLDLAYLRARVGSAPRK